MVQVFVSYVRRDQEVVGHIVEDLENAGHKVFLDTGITGGQQWWDTILEEIERSAVFMPVLSPAYLDSEPCRREAKWAAAVGIPVIPVRVGPTSPAQFPEWIARTHWVSYDSNDRKALAELFRAIASAAPVRPPAAPPERPEIPITYLAELGAELRAEQDIPRSRQVVILDDLQRRLGDLDGDADARELLALLAKRPEVTADVHRQIAELLEQESPRRLRDLLSEPAKRRFATARPEASKVTGPSQPAAPGQHPPQQPRQQPSQQSPRLPPQMPPPRQWSQSPQFGRSPTGGWSAQPPAANTRSTPNPARLVLGVVCLAVGVLLAIVGAADKQYDGYSGSHANYGLIGMGVVAMIAGVVVLIWSRAAAKRSQGRR